MIRILFLFFSSFFFFSCSEDVTSISRTKQEQLDLDLKRIEGYLEENNLTGFSSLENGLHYKILDVGNSKYPVNGDTISVDYVGQLLNGAEFDRNNTGTIALREFIGACNTLGIPETQHMNFQELFALADIDNNKAIHFHERHGVAKRS